MIKLDDNLLAELGLQALPAEEKKNLLRHIYETLEMRVGTTLAQQMTDAQLDEFEGFINGNDEAGALHWLETNFPNYKDVVAHEFELLKNEVRQAAPQILASAAAQPAMVQQPMQQMPADPYQQPQQQYQQPMQMQQPMAPQQPYGQPQAAQYQPQPQQYPQQPMPQPQMPVDPYQQPIDPMAMSQQQPQYGQPQPQVQPQYVQPQPYPPAQQPQSDQQQDQSQYGQAA